MTRGRDAALDNLKGLLIISVVYVHLYDMLGQKTPLLFTIRTIVLAVQMPLFWQTCGKAAGCRVGRISPSVFAV